MDNWYTTFMPTYGKKQQMYPLIFTSQKVFEIDWSSFKLNINLNIRDSGCLDGFFFC